LPAACAGGFAFKKRNRIYPVIIGCCMEQKTKADEVIDLPEIEINNQLMPDDLPTEQPSAVGRKSVLNKYFFIGAPAVLIILIISGALLFYYPPPVVTPKAKPIPVALGQTEAGKEAEGVNTGGQSVRDPLKTNTAYFTDFIVELKDKAGKSRILMYDITCDLTEGKSISELENRKDVRNLIYQITKGKDAIALKSIEERKKLKNELLARLNKMCGDDVIKNVYFANFVIM